MINIPEPEIRKRLQKLRNYEGILHPQLKERSSRLRLENRTLKNRVKKLEAENKQIEKLRLELEELRILKFGKRREKNGIKAGAVPNKEDEKKDGKKNKKRSAESYRRPEPNKDEVTDHLLLEIKECPECGAELADKKEHTHYREDLYEVENLIKSAKKVVETIIESGKCSECKKRQFAMEVPKQKVLIGQNIRNMVVYMTIVQGQSYTETQKGLRHQYGINLSSGEISNILEGESILATPYYNHIVKELEKEEGAHYDETSWKTESRGEEISEGNYCWVKIGVQSNNQLIWLGRSRGKGVAELLRGEEKGSKGVSDDYGVYRNMFEEHQLCWAHPNRKLRDLAESRNLTGKRKSTCKKAYKSFSGMYKKSRRAREKLLAGAWTEEEKTKQKAELEKLFDSFTEPNPNDPEKLKAIRNSLRERKDRYFTFFKFPLLPLDNNKAERAIRKVVLRRKKSFGCRSPKGANVLSILYSVVFSVLESNPDRNFFELYGEAIDFEE